MKKRLIDFDLIRSKAFADPDSGEAIVYLQDIDEISAVDAVEVVRCDKCKHFKHDEANDEWYCRKSGTDIEYVDSLTHFCSYGERMDGD